MTDERKPFSERRKGERRGRNLGCKYDRGFTSGHEPREGCVDERKPGSERRKAERPASGSTPKITFSDKVNMRAIPGTHGDGYEIIEGPHSVTVGSTGSVTGSGAPEPLTASKANAAERDIRAQLREGGNQSSTRRPAGEGQVSDASSAAAPEASPFLPASATDPEFVPLARVLVLLRRARKLGYSLEAGSELESMTIEELQRLVGWTQ